MSYFHTVGETCVPDYIFVGHVRNYPWTLVYYDKEKIEKELEETVVRTLGYSKDSLYCDSPDYDSFLFSEEEPSEEIVFNRDWTPPAYYTMYEIEDAREYVRELEKNKE